MTKPKNVPSHVQLSDVEACALSAFCALTQSFPYSLQKLARVRFDRLQESLTSGTLDQEGLVSAAYLGFAPIPVSYGRFIVVASRLNEMSDNPLAFMTDAEMRENSAAGEYGMSRSEMKRLLKRLNSLAAEFAGVPTYEALFNCGDEILNDPSPHAPEDREVYAKGPLYLWDLAKAVNEHGLDDVVFETSGEWITFLHRDSDGVIGHAILPEAYRGGNFSEKSYVDFELLYALAGTYDSIPILDVPSDVNAALEELAAQRFPGVPFTISDQLKLSGTRYYHPSPSKSVAVRARHEA